MRQDEGDWEEEEEDEEEYWQAAVLEREQEDQERYREEERRGDEGDGVGDRRKCIGRGPEATTGRVEQDPRSSIARKVRTAFFAVGSALLAVAVAPQSRNTLVWLFWQKTKGRGRITQFPYRYRPTCPAVAIISDGGLAESRAFPCPAADEDEPRAMPGRAYLSRVRQS